MATMHPFAAQIADRRPPNQYEICVDLRRFKDFDWRWSELLNRHGTEHLYCYAYCNYFRCLICDTADYGYRYSKRNYAVQPYEDPQDHDWVYTPGNGPFLDGVPVLQCSKCYKLWVTHEYVKTQKCL
jgi:hypothetical protein